MKIWTFIEGYNDMSNVENLTGIHCSECSIYFGITDITYDSCKKNSKRIYHCPNGHKQHFPDKNTDELSQLRIEVKELKEKLDIADKKIEELTLELEIWKPANKETA